MRPVCPALLKPEQPPGQAGMAGGLPSPWHTPAAAGYLAASTQAGSCGRLGAKAGLPPGIVPQPQLGRIIEDSSARERRRGGSLCPLGVPGLGEHSPAARETPSLCSPWVRAVGAHRRVLGHGCSQMGVGTWVLTDGCCGLWGHGGSRPLGLALPGTGTAGRHWWLSLRVLYSHRWWGL